MRSKADWNQLCPRLLHVAEENLIENENEKELKRNEQLRTDLIKEHVKAIRSFDSYSLSAGYFAFLKRD